MLHNPWIMSWLLAAILWIVAWAALKRAGFMNLHAAAFSAMFFTAPLFVLVGGANSFVFATDLLPVLIIPMLLPRWNSVPRQAKRIGLALLFSLGALPLALTLTMRPERNDILFGMANAYRLFVDVCLFWLACVIPIRQEMGERFREGRWLLSFSLTTCILGVALVLQYRGTIDANIYYNWSGADLSTTDMTAGLAVAGLFRGTLGFIGIMGVAAFIANRGQSKIVNVLAIAGAVAGLGIIVLVGSKTSLIVACIMFGLALFRSLSTGLGKMLLTLIVVALAAIVLGRYILPMLPENYVARVFGVLTASEQSTDTLTNRMTRWQLGWDAVMANPMVLLGTSLPMDPDQEGKVITWWHNEYLGALMNGGLITFGFYLIGISKLGRELWTRFSRHKPATIFAGLLFVNGLIQGLTVCHLVPGLFFTATVAMSLAAYGLSFNESADPQFEAGSEELSAQLVLGDSWPIEI